MTGSTASSPLPRELTCVSCSELATEAVLLPCCAALACYACAVDDLAFNANRCWLGGRACRKRNESASNRAGTVMPDDLIPNHSVRRRVDQHRKVHGVKQEVKVKQEKVRVKQEHDVKQEVEVKQEKGVDAAQPGPSSLNVKKPVEEEEDEDFKARIKAIKREPRSPSPAPVSPKYAEDSDEGEQQFHQTRVKTEVEPSEDQDEDDDRKVVTVKKEPRSPSPSLPLDPPDQLADVSSTTESSSSVAVLTTVEAAAASKKKPQPGNVCYLCRAADHLTRNCPSLRTKKCKSCGVVGHVSFCCPERKRKREEEDEAWVKEVSADLDAVSDRFQEAHEVLSSGEEEEQGKESKKRKKKSKRAKKLKALEKRIEMLQKALEEKAEEAVVKTEVKTEVKSRTASRSPPKRRERTSPSSRSAEHKRRDAKLSDRERRRRMSRSPARSDRRRSRSPARKVNRRRSKSPSRKERGSKSPRRRGTRSKSPGGTKVSRTRSPTPRTGETKTRERKDEKGKVKSSKKTPKKEEPAKAVRRVVCLNTPIKAKKEEEKVRKEVEPREDGEMSQEDGEANPPPHAPSSSPNAKRKRITWPGSPEPPGEKELSGTTDVKDPHKLLPRSLYCSCRWWETQHKCGRCTILPAFITGRKDFSFVFQEGKWDASYELAVQIEVDENDESVTVPKGTMIKVVPSRPHASLRIVGKAGIRTDSKGCIKIRLQLRRRSGDDRKVFLPRTKALALVQLIKESGTKFADEEGEAEEEAEEEEAPPTPSPTPPPALLPEVKETQQKETGVEEEESRRGTPVSLSSEQSVEEKNEEMDRFTDLRERLSRPANTGKGPLKPIAKRREAEEEAEGGGKQRRRQRRGRGGGFDCRRLLTNRARPADLRDEIINSRRRQCRDRDRPPSSTSPGRREADEEDGSEAEL